MSTPERIYIYPDTYISKYNVGQSNQYFLPPTHNKARTDGAEYILKSTADKTMQDALMELDAQRDKQIEAMLKPIRGFIDKYETDSIHLASYHEMLELSRHAISALKETLSLAGGK